MDVFKQHWDSEAFINKKAPNDGSIRVQAKENLIKLVSIINGNFRGPKILKLYECVDWFNDYHSLNIEKKPLDNSRLPTNA